MAEFRRPRKPLQAYSSNVPMPASPRTPTKKGSNPQSPRSPQTPNIARRLAALEERHRAVKADYESLRAKYAEDVKHFRAWKAYQDARSERKRRKKEERNQVRRNVESGSTPSRGTITTASHEPTSTEVVGADSDVSAAVPSEPQNESIANEILVEDSEESAKREVDGAAAESKSPEPKALVPNPGVSSNNAINEVGVHPRTPRIHSATPQPAPRISESTPWLGQGDRPRPIGMTPTFHDIETPDAERATSSGAGPSRPLVRDRGETPSLRRSAMTNRVMAELKDSRALERKRSWTMMEGLSPADKAVQLKKLSRLPASEKREVYAVYKGKGRYIRPDALYVSSIHTV